MKLIIDEKACQKHKMTLEEVLLTLALRRGLTGNDIQEMLEKEILVEGKGTDWYQVTQHWSDVIDDILLDSVAQERTDEQLLDLALKVQECFPKQKMKDRWGRETSYYYRCNRTEIKRHLKMFFEGYGNVPDEEVLDATKRYVASFNGDYNGKMRLAKYFIWKNDRKMNADEEVHVEQLSDLATFIENKEAEEDRNNGTGDFTTKLI